MLLVGATDQASASDFANMSLPTVLSSFRRFECTESVDKLFALYGLARHHVERLGLKPNYTTKPKKVYMDLTLAIMRELRDLSVLEIARGNSKLRPNLTSWVRDWS